MSPGVPAGAPGRLDPEADGLAATARQEVSAAGMARGQHLQPHAAHLELVAGPDRPDLRRARALEQPLRAARPDQDDVRPEPAQRRDMEVVRVLVGDQHHVRLAGRLPRGRAAAAEVPEAVDEQRVDGDADLAELEGRGRVPPPGHGQRAGHRRVVTGVGPAA